MSLHDDEATMRLLALLGLKKVNGHEPVQTAHAQGNISAASTISATSSNGAEKSSVTHNVSQKLTEEAWKKRLASGESTIGGQITVFGLDTIRSAIPDLSPEIEACVPNIVEDCIKRQLETGDVYAPHGEANFALLFADHRMEVVERRVNALATLVVEAIAADFPQAADWLVVDPFVAQIDGERREEDEDLIEFLVREMERLKQEVEQEARQIHHNLRATPIRYAPVWHTRHHMTYLNRCLAKTQRADLSEFILDPSAEMLADDPVSSADYFNLSEALRCLHKLRLQRAVPALLVPVNFSTLSRRSPRRAYLRLLKAMPTVYSRFLMLEIQSWHLKARPSEVSRLALILSRYVHRIVLQLPMRGADYSALPSTGVWGASFSLQEAERHPFLRASSVRRHVQLIRAKGLVVLAQDADSLGLVQCAMQTGVDLIDGNAVHLQTQTPRPPLRLKPMVSVKQRNWS